MVKREFRFVDILGVLPNKAETLKSPFCPGKPKGRPWGEVASEPVRPLRQANTGGMCHVPNKQGHFSKRH